MENHASKFWNDSDNGRIKVSSKVSQYLTSNWARYWFIYHQLWWILASCPCPRTLNSGSVGLEYAFSASLPADVKAQQILKFPILYHKAFFSHVHFTILMAKSTWGVRYGCLLLSWERGVFSIVPYLYSSTQRIWIN